VAELIRTTVRKLGGKRVRQPFANLRRDSLPKSGPQGVSLFRRKLGEPVGNPVRKSLPQLVRNPFLHDGADGCALLWRELGKPFRKTVADLT